MFLVSISCLNLSNNIVVILSFFSKLKDINLSLKIITEHIKTITQKRYHVFSKQLEFYHYFYLDVTIVRKQALA